MYTIKDRNEFLNDIIKKVKKSNNIIGTYLIGSSAIGFNDIYSDCDFMMAYKEELSPSEIRTEILSFFKKEKIGYIMERKWTDKIWGLSIYLTNGLSTDISFGPLADLKIKSPQIGIGADTNNLLENHLKEGQEIFKAKYANYNITNQINWDFMYLIRKYLIAIKRDNYIYAYQLLNEARILVMKIEGLNEGKKLHEFKAYNELDEIFLKSIVSTIPKDLSKEELDTCKNNLLEIFYKVLEESSILEFDPTIKCLLEIAN